jgi:hypothetical protein
MQLPDGVLIYGSRVSGLVAPLLQVLALNEGLFLKIAGPNYTDHPPRVHISREFDSSIRTTASATPKSTQ